LKNRIDQTNETNWKNQNIRASIANFKFRIEKIKQTIETRTSDLRDIWIVGKALMKDNCSG